MNNRRRIISTTMERMLSKEHLPKKLIRLLGHTALIQAEAPTQTTIPATHGIKSGRRTPGDFKVAPEPFTTMAGQILALVLSSPDEYPEQMVQAAGVLKEGCDSGQLILETAFREMAARFTGAGTPEPVLAHWSTRTPEAPSALGFLVMAAAAPALSAWSQALSMGMDAERIHSQGSCPVCGCLPYMLELSGIEGRRLAHCPFCRHTYRVRRIACTCCNSDGAGGLKVMTDEKEPGYRVETCDNCNTYIKTIDFRKLDRETFAPLNDLESLPLDILAADHGYSRMAPSIWCI